MHKVVDRVLPVYPLRMTKLPIGTPIVPKREYVDGTCVDCGRQVDADQVARVLRRPSDGRPARVVCVDCSARLHAAKQPAPLQVQRMMPRAQAPRVES
jgi:DNA-directed RNA polymerase subunit RPC12/RpoP